MAQAILPQDQDQASLYLFLPGYHRPWILGGAHLRTIPSRGLLSIGIANVEAGRGTPKTNADDAVSRNHSVNQRLRLSLSLAT